MVLIKRSVLLKNKLSLRTLSAWKKRLSIKGSHSKKSTKTDSGGQLSFARITVSHPYRANDRSKLNSDVVGVQLEST